jgi:hypothetical protein
VRLTPAKGVGQYTFATALGRTGAAVVWVPGSGPGPVRFRTFVP